MEKAKDKARAELTKAISSTIEVRQEYRVDSKGEGKDEEIDRKYSDQMRITATLRSLPEINPYRSESSRQGTKHYALVRLERVVYQKYIQDQWDKVREIVAHGDLSIETRDVVPALREYSKALDVARTLPFRDQKASLSDIGIERKITHIENDLEIKAVSGYEQVGTYGESLAEALVVQVHYQGSPFASFPLWATYTRGTGQLRNSSGEMGRSVRVPTDANGQAIFWVEDIKSLSRVNRIRVNAKHLSVSTGVDFHYRSLFSTRHSAQDPVIYLNGSADEQAFAENSVIQIEVQVPGTCHLHLFEILADGHFRYRQSVPIKNEHHGAGWRILRKSSNWALEIDESPVTAASGSGLETLLVITTEKEWQPVGAMLTPEGLIRQLDEKVGAGAWQVDWASYLVEKDRLR